MLLHTASVLYSIIYYCKAGPLIVHVLFLIATYINVKIPAALKWDTCIHYNKTLPSTCCFHNGPLEETLLLFAQSVRGPHCVDYYSTLYRVGYFTGGIKWSPILFSLEWMSWSKHQWATVEVWASDTHPKREAVNHLQGLKPPIMLCLLSAWNMKFCLVHITALYCNYRWY